MSSASRLRCCTAWCATALFSLLLGCDNLDIERQVANRPPDTRITSGPPDRTTATSYRVQLAWMGTDPDGSIAHYEYLIVDHPAAYDSTAQFAVTVPAADDARWRATAAHESTFTVGADTLHRDVRPGAGETPADVLRAFYERWHTCFVRAVDDRGSVDPTPDYRTFNARTLAPTVALSFPVVPGEVLLVSTSTTLRWEGEDPLSKTALDVPDSSRWVIIPSGLNYRGDFLAFPDSLYSPRMRFLWSPWRAWNAPDGSGIQATLHNLRPAGTPGQGFYLVAVQAKDAAGAVTPVFDHQTPGKNNVARLMVSPDLGPVVVLQEPLLGTFVWSAEARPVELTIGAGQPIRFRWRADSSGYASTVEAYRYGWDLADPESDSGWEEGWCPTCTRQVVPRQFAAGEIHRFYLQVRDVAGNTTRIVLALTALPLTMRRDLLFVDDSTYPLDDRATEALEDRCWEAVLDSLVDRYHFQFDRYQDIYDVETNRWLPPPAPLLFDYKAVVWASRAYSPRIALRRLSYFFDPYVSRNRNAIREFSYLDGYVENGGRLWVNGEAIAYTLWPLADRAFDSQVPADILHWDDPIQPHPGVDSVGATGLLYKLGVETVDVGGGSRAPRLRRDRLPHLCLGFRRGFPAALATQVFASETGNPLATHYHSLRIPSADIVEEPPDGGHSYATNEIDGHFHMVQLGAAQLRRLQTGAAVRVGSSPPSAGPSHGHLFQLVDQSDLGGAPVWLEPDSLLWPLPLREYNPLGGRANIEIYNVPAYFMSARMPPPVPPPAWRVRTLYTYASGVPRDLERGLDYPFTADGQPSVLVARRTPSVPHYTLALCGFEPWRLQPGSHRRLADYILQHEFQLWPGAARSRQTAGAR